MSTWRAGWPSAIRLASVQRAEKAAHVPASRDRREVIESPKQPGSGQRLQHSQGEGRATDPSPGESQPDHWLPGRNARRPAPILDQLPFKGRKELRIPRVFAIGGQLVVLSVALGLRHLGLFSGRQIRFRRFDLKR